MHGLILGLLASSIAQGPAPLPAVDGQRTAYVSTTGDNTTAALDDVSRPYATIAAACKALAPTGAVSSGTVLLERGGTYVEVPPFNSGLTPEQPWRVGSYGTGPRPVVLVAGNQVATRLVWRHVRISGIDFYGRADDPAANEPGFTPRGCQWGVTVLRDGPIENVVIEDCRFRSCMVAVQRWPGPARVADRIAFRRCVFADAYGPGLGVFGQNLFVSLVPLTLENSVLDHGGWNETVPGGGATIFEHNAYINGCPNLQITGNTFSRASSIGLKVRSDVAGGCPNPTVRDNLFIEGDVGLSIGGNTAARDRFTDAIVENNVFLRIGKTRPTNRNIGWGIEVKDWRGGTIAGNVMIGEPEVSNSYFLCFRGGFDGVAVDRNYCTGIKSTAGAICADGGEQRLSFTRNTFDVADGLALAFTAPPARVAWRDNSFGGAASTRREVSVRLQANAKPTGLAGFLAAVGEPMPMPADPAGLPLPLPEFLARIREQGQTGAWDESLSAPAINARIRAAVGVR